MGDAYKIGISKLAPDQIRWLLSNQEKVDLLLSLAPIEQQQLLEELRSVEQEKDRRYHLRNIPSDAKPIDLMISEALEKATAAKKASSVKKGPKMKRSLGKRDKSDEDLRS